MLLSVIIAVLFGGIIIYYMFILKKYFDKRKLYNNCHFKVDDLWKEIPLSVPLDWNIFSIENGISLWSKSLNGQLRVACHSILQGTSEDVLKQLLELEPSQCRLNKTNLSTKKVNFAKRQPEGQTNRDMKVIQDNHSKLRYLKGMFWPNLYWPSTHVFERHWSIADESAWLTVLPKYQNSCKKYGKCWCYLVKDIPAKQNESSSMFSYVSIMMRPETEKISRYECRKLTEKIIAIRETMDAVFLKQILSSKLTTKKSNSKRSLNHNSVSGDLEQQGNGISEHQKSNSKITQLKLKLPNEGEIEHAAAITTSPVTSNGSLSPLALQENPKEIRYKKEIDASVELLMEMYNATTTSPDWQYIGCHKNVDVWKLPGDEECRWDGYVGTIEVDLPLKFVLPHLLNPKFKMEWDDMTDDSIILEVLDELTKITHLLYKAIWPVSGRDFVTTSALRHIKDNLYGVAVKSVDYPELSSVKGRVRADIIIGGFVLEDINEMKCKLSYVSRADIKGNIPGKIVNKVSSAQPYTVVLMKTKMEQFYKEGNGDEARGEYLLQLARNYNKENLPTPSTDSTSSDGFGSCDEKHVEDLLEDGNSKENTLDDVDSEKILETKISALDAATMDEDQLKGLLHDGIRCLSPVDDDNMSEMSFSSVADSERDVAIMSDLEDLTVNASSSKLRTIGNQAAALLLQEVLLASEISIRSQIPSQPNNEWTFQGISKDIVMMKKIDSKQKIHSFLGRGVINTLPVTIWEAITNPTTRFVYDSMLKKITVLEEIERGKYKIIHMRHETTACFVRQARDFVILTSERVDNNKYVLSGISVNYASCPPIPGCVRGKVLSSGWIIEPILKNGKLCSLVTYISQINFGGRLPSRLINHIAKRQPLSIAYLRDYIEGF